MTLFALGLFLGILFGAVIGVAMKFMDEDKSRWEEQVYEKNGLRRSW